MSKDEERYPQMLLCVEENIREEQEVQKIYTNGGNTLQVYQDVQKTCTNRGNTLRVYQDVQKTCTNRGKRELTPFGLMVKMELIKMEKKQVDLAKYIGVSKQYLYLVLHGMRPGTKYIDQIVAYCELNPEIVEKVIAERKQTRRMRK